MPQYVLPSEKDSVFIYGQDNTDPEEQKLAFRRRQQGDLERYIHGPSLAGRHRDPFTQTKPDQASPGNLKWRDSDGETLEDFGVDEDIDEDDVPLAELLRTRKLARSVASSNHNG